MSDIQNGTTNTGLKDSMKVEVVDAFNNAEPNITVRWLVTDTLDLTNQKITPGKIPFSTSATDAIGNITFSLTSATPGATFDSTTTDANGLAANRLVAGPLVGIQHVAVSVQSLTSQGFTANIVQGSADKAATNPPKAPRPLPFMLFTVAIGGGIGAVGCSSGIRRRSRARPGSQGRCGGARKRCVFAPFSLNRRRRIAAR